MRRRASNGEPRLEMNEPSALIERCQAGEAEAFEELYELYRDRVFRLAWSLSGDRAVAADVVQEVFVKLMTRIRQYRFASAFETWLYRVVLNVFRDHVRAARWTALTPEHARSLRADAPQQSALERDEAERQVRAAVAALRPKLREPIVLRYMSGLSYDDIAAVLGVSAGTVASRLSRGHAALAEKLRHLR